MAAIALTANTPDRTTISTTRQRYTMPSGATWVRIYSASDCYLELVDGSDGSALGTDYETLVGGQAHSRQIRRGEFCVSGSASQSLEVTAATKPG